MIFEGLIVNIFMMTKVIF